MDSMINFRIQKIREVLQTSSAYIPLQVRYNVENTLQKIEKMETSVVDSRLTLEIRKKLLELLTAYTNKNVDEIISINKKLVNFLSINERNTLNLKYRLQEANKNHYELSRKFVEAKDTIDALKAETEKYKNELVSYKSESDKKIEQTIDEYTKANEQILKDLKETSTKAANILQYANAAGLSESFNKQLYTAKNWKIIGLWLFGATIFLLLTLKLGYSTFEEVNKILTSDSASNLSSIIFAFIGRLSIMSIALTGAVFCANQYTKQKTLIEDYAYKAAIAKSIAAFSEELREKSPEEYSKYIALVTKEIYQDPLRKRGKEKEDLKKSKENFTISEESLGLIEKIIKIAKIQDTNS